MVTIRGKDAAVKAAKVALEEEAAQLRLQSFSGTVIAAPEFHRFLIGRGGSNMKNIRDLTGCRIAVPGMTDNPQILIFKNLTLGPRVWATKKTGNSV